MISGIPSHQIYISKGPGQSTNKVLSLYSTKVFRSERDGDSSIRGSRALHSHVPLDRLVDGSNNLKSKGGKRKTDIIISAPESVCSLHPKDRQFLSVTSAGMFQIKELRLPPSPLPRRASTLTCITRT